MPGEHDVREITTKCGVHSATVRRKLQDGGLLWSDLGEGLLIIAEQLPR